MNQEIILETKKTLQAIFSSACDQPLLIYIGECPAILVQGLKQNIQPHQKIIIISAQEITNTFKDDGVFYTQADSFNIFLNTCRTVLEHAQELRYRIIVNDQNNSSLSDLSNKIKTHVTGIIKEITGNRFRTELQFHNFFMNIPELCLGHGISKIKNIAKGKTTVVLGAGPSLKEQIPWLKENSARLFIIAAGSIATGLFENDIHPDLYVETDHRAPTHWEHVNPSNYKLAATSTITAGLASRFKQVFWMESNSSHRDWFYEWEKKLCPGIDRLKSPDQNTGLTAAGLAVYCGSESIILIGIDLCLSPDGNSHSSFFHRGKDKVNVSKQMQTVKNNKGESCPTIYGAFINGFKELISLCPDTQFIQTSENGIQLEGALFRKTESCVLKENKCEINIPEKPLLFKELRPTFKELKRYIQSFNWFPENDLQKQLLDLIQINSCILDCSIEEEFTRQKGKYLHSINQSQNILHELQNKPNPFKELNDCLADDVSDVGVQIDWQKEYELAGLPIDLELTHPDSWKLDWQRMHMMQLLIRNEAQWQPVSGQYEITEKAGELLNQFLSKHEGNIDKIICIGVWDGNHIMLLASKFAHCKFTVIEPDSVLLGKILRYVPLASKLPKDTKWCTKLEDVDELELKNSLIICPDINAKFLPKLTQIYNDALIKIKNL